MAEPTPKDIHLVEWFTDERLDAYRDWRQDRRTEVMLSVIRKFFVPAGLSHDCQTGEKALYYAGAVDTASQILNVLTDLDEIVLSLRRAKKLETVLRPDYGAEKTLREEGYISPEGRK